MWYIINDLLNRELIKQNFRFKKPIVPEDDEIEESKEMNDGDDPALPHQILDSSKQSLREYFKQCDVLGIEEQLTKNENVETAFDDDENEMIMPSVDPSDWLKEVERVQKYIDKDIDFQGNVIESRKSMSFKKKYVEATNIDEVLERIENITNYFKIITDFIYEGGK